MNKKVIEAYKHYKSLYGSQLLLFRVRDNYEAYFDDAEYIVSRSESGSWNALGVIDERVIIPVGDALNVVGALFESGRECKLISYRNKAGEFDIPDVKTLLEEQNMDF